MGGRIAIDNSGDVGTEAFADRRRILQRVPIGLSDQFAGERGVIEPFGQPVDNSSLERVEMQNARINESSQLRFVASHILGFAADARPDRIDLVENRLRLMLRHLVVLPERHILE